MGYSGTWNAYADMVDKSKKKMQTKKNGDKIKQKKIEEIVKYVRENRTIDEKVRCRIHKYVPNRKIREEITDRQRKYIIDKIDSISYDEPRKIYEKLLNDQCDILEMIDLIKELAQMECKDVKSFCSQKKLQEDIENIYDNPYVQGNDDRDYKYFIDEMNKFLAELTRNRFIKSSKKINTSKKQLIKLLEIKKEAQKDAFVKAMAVNEFCIENRLKELAMDNKEILIKKKIENRFEQERLIEYIINRKNYENIKLGFNIIRKKETKKLEELVEQKHEENQKEKKLSEPKEQKKPKTFWSKVKEKVGKGIKRIFKTFTLASLVSGLSVSGATVANEFQGNTNYTNANKIETVDNSKKENSSEIEKVREFKGEVKKQSQVENTEVKENKEVKQIKEAVVDLNKTEGLVLYATKYLDGTSCSVDRLKNEREKLDIGYAVINGEFTSDSNVIKTKINEENIEDISLCLGYIEKEEFIPMGWTNLSQIRGSLNVTTDYSQDNININNSIEHNTSYEEER